MVLYAKGLKVKRESLKFQRRVKRKTLTHLPKGFTHGVAIPNQYRLVAELVHDRNEF